MAKITDTDLNKEPVNTELLNQESDTQATEPTNEPNTQVPANISMADVMKLIQEQAAKIKELEAGIDKSAQFRSSREHYKGPRHYSYKLRGGKPVLSYVSKRKDPTKDLMFKNQFGQPESNHIMVLTLWDGSKKETMEVESTEFGANFERSDKMTAQVTSDGDQTTSYIFTTPEYGTFTVLPNSIN